MPISSPVSRSAWFVSLLTLLVSSTSRSVAVAGGQIAWENDVEHAFEIARRDNKPIFVAINMDGEKANDEAVKTIYHDSKILNLVEDAVPLFASRFDHGAKVCPRAGVVSCEAHAAIEKEIRKRYLASQGTQVVAPQHLWIGPDGTMLLSVPYKVSVDELAWCFGTAFKKVKPTHSGPAPDTRAPRRLVMDGVTGVDDSLLTGPPPTAKEVEQLIETMRKESRPWEATDTLYQILLSDEKKALDYIRGILTAGGGGGRGGGGGGRMGRWKSSLIHAIGRYSPMDYWPLLVPLLDDPEPLLRREAAVALEQLVAPKALPALQKRYKKEEEVEVQKELIRAIASCGREKSAAVRQVLQVVAKEKEEILRINAVVGLMYLEDGDELIEQAKLALADSVAGIRAAGGYLVGVRRETSLRKSIEEAIVTEKEIGVKSAFESVLKVIDGASVSDLDPILVDYAQSDIPRDRVR